MNRTLNSCFVIPFALLLLCFSVTSTLLAEVIDESGSLLEFFAGQEGNCAYDNWISHVSEYDYFGNGDGYFAPHELDRETNGFGSYQVVDDMVDPDGVLADWSTIFQALLQNQVAAAENCLAQSDFAGFYEIVRLNDNGTQYLIVRELLNNNFTDDNGTVDEGDDVTGSFDLGWGLYVFKPSASNPELIIEVVHPCADFIAPYVAIDAFLTTDAAAFFINGASRNIAWSGNVYNTSNSLSDPSRNERTPFHEAHKAAVDLIENEWVMQVHGYNAYPQHDGIPSVQLSAERENYTAHPNAPYMNWDHIDLISLTPNPAVPNGGGWAYPEVSIDEYYTASYPGGYKYRGYIPIPNNVDLPGTVDNNQMVYTHTGHDFINDRENWLHMELDEFPDVVRNTGTSILDFYKYDSQNIAVPTYNNYFDVVHYYRPVFTAVADYMSYQLSQATFAQESASLQEFYLGTDQDCDYDNWVSHISEGIASPGYNDYGPVELDRQTTGFGNFQLIPEDVGGDSLLDNWRLIMDALLQGQAGTVQTLLTSSRLGNIYEVAQLTEGGDEYLILREKLNNYYSDDNGTSDAGDDVTGSFDYGWGLYVVNLNATQPQVVIEVPHPCDDYTSPAIGLDAFQTIDAGMLYVASAGREVLWTEVAPYYNSKSLSDPTRNSRHPFQIAHEAAVDLWQDDLVIQIHTYDTDSHPDSYDSELSTANDYFPNRPIMDSGTYFDIISLTPEYPIVANSIGSENHAARRVDEYYSLYYGGGYSHQGNITISNYIEQPGYSENAQMLYSHVGHDVNSDDENWFHVEHDEFPNPITEAASSFYNFGSSVPTYANYVNAVAYFHPLYEAFNAYFEGPNYSPIWTDMPVSVTVDEGVLISFTVNGTDPDGDALSILLDPDGIPVGYNFTDNGDGTGDFTWQTGVGDGGDYNATFTLSDGDLTDVAIVPITVTGAPEPQIAFADGEQAVAGTITGNYANTANSDNSYEIITERESGGRPANRHSYLEHIWTFQINGFDLELNAEAFHSNNGEGDDFVLSGSFDGQAYTDLITITKTADDNNVQTAVIDGIATGSYFVKVVDTDQTVGNRNLDSFSLDLLSITYMVGEIPNQAPAWTDVPESISANEGDLVEFSVSGTDPEGDGLALSVNPDGIPDGWEFTDNGDGTGLFSWQTSQGEEGDYAPVFTISDGELTEDVIVPISISVPGQNIMLVSDIDQTPSVKKRNTKSIAVISITDDGGTALADATVLVTWSGLYDGNVQGTTDGNGQVTFESGSIRNADGFFIVTVTDVEKANWTYDSNQNIVTTDSLGVGDAVAGDFAFGSLHALPNIANLDPAYPNPFNSQTTIRYGIPDGMNIKIAIYDSQGRKVSSLLDEFMPAGWHSSIWYPGNLANGGYIVRFESANSIQTRYVVYVK